MMKCFLPIVNIDKKNLCTVGIKKHLICLKVYFINLVYYYFVLLLGPKYFNIKKSVLCFKKSTFGLLITFKRSMITQKRDLVIVSPNISLNLVISGTYNAALLSMKVLTIINA